MWSENELEDSVVTVGEMLLVAWGCSSSLIASCCFCSVFSSSLSFVAAAAAAAAVVVVVIVVVAAASPGWLSRLFSTRLIFRVRPVITDLGGVFFEIPPVVDSFCLLEAAEAGFLALVSLLRDVFALVVVASLLVIYTNPIGGKIHSAPIKPRRLHELIIILFTELFAVVLVARAAAGGVRPAVVVFVVVVAVVEVPRALLVVVVGDVFRDSAGLARVVRAAVLVALLLWTAPFLAVVAVAADLTALARVVAAGADLAVE